MSDYEIYEIIVDAVEPPDVSQLTTEDDTPVDNLPSEKQQRLSTTTLYDNDAISRPFLAAANIAIYSRAVEGTAIVPDVLLSLDVSVSEEFWQKKHRAYLTWVFDKSPEIVIEIVSNKKGNELGSKMSRYARLGVWYYVVYDPNQYIQDEKVAVYELQRGSYKLKSDLLMDAVGLGLMLWNGVFEDTLSEWLRWTDLEGNLLPTGNERAESERERADNEKERADSEKERADSEGERAEKLATKLRELGIDPDSV